MITKENYEIWMIDMMDGKLSNAQQSELMRFLEAHPEYDVDVSDLNNYTLKAEEVHFSAKTELLKSEADEFGLNISDYEAIEAVEEKTNDTNPLIEAYKKTVLKPNIHINYAQKDRLKRALLIPFISKHRFTQITAAASVALLLGLGATLLKQNPVKTKPTAGIMQTNVEQTQQNKTINTTPETTIVDEGGHSYTITESPNKEVLASIASAQKPEMTEKENLRKMTPKNTLPLKTERVNGYEAGLNNMMPYVIAYNLQRKAKANEMAQLYTEQQSEKLARTQKVFTNGAKVINFLSGNETTIKKYLNEDGQLIAYEVESEGLSFVRKIKNQ